MREPTCDKLHVAFDLQSHTGHKVTVTGAVSEIDDEEEGSEEYREGGIMMVVVTKLQMVGAKCR